MTYVTRGERVFKLPDCRYINCSPPDIKRSDHRLKRYPSATDRRAWACDEVERYQHLYELMTGSQTCLVPSSPCHQYIPLEALIDILLGEQIAYIRLLEDQLRAFEALAMTFPTESESSRSGTVSTAIPTKLEMTPFAAPASMVNGDRDFTLEAVSAPRSSVKMSLTSSLQKESRITSLGSARSEVQAIGFFKSEVESSVKSELEPSGSVKSGLGPSGSVKSGLEPSGSIKSGLEPSGSVKSGLEPSGSVKSGLEPSGSVKSGLEPSGSIKSGLEPSGSVKSGLEPSGSVKSGLVLAGSIKSGLEDSGPIKLGVTPTDSIKSGLADFFKQESPTGSSKSTSFKKESPTSSVKSKTLTESLKSGLGTTSSSKKQSPVSSTCECSPRTESPTGSLKTKTPTESVKSGLAATSSSKKQSPAPSVCVCSPGRGSPTTSLKSGLTATSSSKEKPPVSSDKQICQCSRRRESPTGSEKKISSIFVADVFEESDEEKETEVTAMRSTMTNLKTELANNRDLLRQAMHKLENIDEIMSENSSLRDKLRCSEETIRRLEEKKRDLEKELEKLRSSTQIQKDLKRAKEELAAIRDREEDAQGNEAMLQTLAAERDGLQLEVKELQRELSQAKRCKDEIELLKKQSETASLNFEEMSRENECYKKKLEAMKCLEKQIGELKNQATALSDKYKRESTKANDQINQLTNTAREVKMLREERDRLNKRLEELSKYEKEYHCLQEKFEQVESILSENECLNLKLLELDRLEIENQELRCKIQDLKCKNIDSEGDKQTISQLQDAIAEQEEEMKELLNQIERLTRSETVGIEEMTRLRAEIDEKDEKLKLCEQQLSEIPFLEAEIEELKTKMLKCYEELSPDTESIKRLHQEVKMYRKKFKKFDAVADRSQTASSSADEELDLDPISEKSDFEEGMSCEQIHMLLQSTKTIISNLLGDMIQHQREMEEIEETNRVMKDQLEILKSLREKPDAEDELVHQINQLKQCIKLKDKEICELRQLSSASRNIEEIKRRINQYEKDLEKMNEMNHQLKAELDEAGLSLGKVSELEEMLKTERKARIFSEELVNDLEEKLEKETSVQKVKEDLVKLKKQEENLAIRESFSSMMKEIEDLKGQIEKLKELVEELKNENDLLRELQNPGPDFAKELEEKLELEELLTKCQAELEAIRGHDLKDECKALQEQLRRLMNENDHYKKQTICYKESLECERRAKSMLEAQVEKLQASSSKSSPCDKTLSSLKAKRENITLEECVKERDCWKCEAETLKTRNKCLQEQIRKLCAKIDKKEAVKEETAEELERLRRESDESQRRIGELEGSLRKYKRESEILREEAHRLNSERDVLVNRLRQSEEGAREEIEEYKKSLEDKHAMEKAMRNVEKEMDKLDERKRTEAKDDEKTVKNLENEVDALRKKLAECQKTETELKRERDNLLSMSQGELQRVRAESSKKTEDSDIVDKQKEIEALKKQLEKCRKQEEELANIKKEQKSLLTSASQTEQAIAAEEKKKRLLTSASQTEQAIAAEEKRKRFLTSASQTEQAIVAEEKRKKLLTSASQTEQAIVAEEKKKRLLTSASQTEQDEKRKKAEDSSLKESGKEGTSMIDQDRKIEEMKRMEEARKFEEIKKLEETKKFDVKKFEGAKIIGEGRTVEEAVKLEECRNCKKLEEELESLKEEKETLRKTVEDLGEKQKAMTMKPEECKNCKKLEEELMTLNKENENVKRQLESKEEAPKKPDEIAMDDLQRENDALRKQLEDCKKLEAEANQLKKEKENLETQIKVIKETIPEEFLKQIEGISPQRKLGETTKPAISEGASVKSGKGAETPARTKKLESEDSAMKEEIFIGSPGKDAGVTTAGKPAAGMDGVGRTAMPPSKKKSGAAVAGKESKPTVLPSKKESGDVAVGKGAKPAKKESGIAATEKESGAHERRKEDKTPVSGKGGVSPTKKEDSGLLEDIPSVEDSIAWSSGSAETAKPVGTGSAKKGEARKPAEKGAAPLSASQKGPASFRKPVSPSKTDSSIVSSIGDNCDELRREVRALRSQIANMQNEINRLKNENKKLQLAKSKMPTDEASEPEHIRSAPCLTPVESVISVSDIDPDFEKFKRSFCKEDYKRNIIEIEKRYKIQIQLLEEAHAAKIKTLLNQNEKESSKKDKLFNNNLNTMRSNYEADIKKLAEKHKASILRLQSLHEDEIREINTNYETQMEAIQTQNENVINDLTTGAASKFKELVQQHNHDIQALERKFHQILEEKETEHMYEISNLQANLTRNMDEVEEYHKRTMENVTEALEENISEMQEKHQCQLKKLKKSHAKKTDLIKRKYEELLLEQRKKYEEQLEAIIRKREGGDGCECKFTGFKPKRISDPNAPLEFYDVVHKIIDEGIEALNFNELALVHRKTCYATEDKLLDPDLHPELDPAIGSACPQGALLDADKEHLMQRICVLENEIKAKQLETQEAIINLEIALRAERLRLESIKKALYDEQEVNSELKHLLSNQTRNKSDLEIERNFLSRQASLHENQVLEKVKELEKERAYIRTLEEENQKLRINIQFLSSTLTNPDKNKKKFSSRQDADYIPTKQTR